MEWTRGPTIGRGSTAAVSLASATNIPGCLFAVKSAELSHSLPLQREQSILSKLSSPYIVNYLGFDITREDGKSLYNLWMEYMPGGTLRELIVQRGGFLDEPTVRSFAGRIVEGLSYLHRNGIAHCDLKAQNVLIGENGPKIADFGCAKLIGRNPTRGALVNFLGTPMFMAPEVARGEEQGFGADVWALGCLIIEMVAGASPWTNVSDLVSLLYRIGFSEDVPEIPAWLSEDAHDFLNKCLSRDPRQRQTAEQLLGHPFLFGWDRSAKVGRLDMDSPIGVLDRRFWDLTEGMASELDLETSPNVGAYSETDSASAGKRIMRLNGITGSITVMPDWTDTADWVTIRSHDQERPEPSLNDSISEARPSTTNHDEAELELPIAANNDLYQLLFHEENSGVSTTFNTNPVFMTHCHKVVHDDFGLMNFDFDTDNVNINIHDLEQQSLLELLLLFAATEFSILYISIWCE
ncbi:mitogen-activated protein kinase kinase kinase 18-like [Punica granatum]|uniref:Protein kinase domain-containing protein n=2 Tax=Punica granatum TaxID=22663 RepID=A0A218X942_PUNGR|nr:mitogen-activated protein kinase kinase kinase 18-like [Punica granatum]OWM81288.1 hypothetical protein CDL15_Pgr007326 [Punica granatum]PKI67723.1 hypothetical protein CRG98_011936 [Punica granatum]